LKDSKTEQHLKETARTIFLKEGKMMATTQEIADAAGVNRTLLHYYFRSREALFDIIFLEALTRLRKRLHEALDSGKPFREKIENIVQVFVDELTELPYLETFITLQLNQQPDKYQNMFVQLPGGKERLKKFLKEIQTEMDKGTIPTMKPLNFFVSLFSLLAYPYIARPLYKNMFDLSENAYSKLLQERKEVIFSMMFKKE